MIINSNIEELNLDVKVPNVNKLSFNQNKPINKTQIETVIYPNITVNPPGDYSYDNFVYNEDLIGDKDGSNNTFTIPDQIVPDSEQIISNGFIINKPEDYNISGSIVILNFSPDSEEQLTSNYIKQ